MSSTSQRASEAGGRIIGPDVSSAIRVPTRNALAKRAADDRRRGAEAEKILCRPFGARIPFCVRCPGLAPGATLCRRLRRLVVAILVTGLLLTVVDISASIASAQSNSNALSDTARAPQTPDVSRYLDQANGMTVDEAVTYALAHNGELEAARKEIDAAKARSRQARLRANPKVDLEGTRQIPPGKDNSVMATAMLPLELGGRRSTRIAVAEREVEVREREVANRERLLAGEIRMKFGEALAQAMKLSFTDELVEANQQSFNLVAARVVEGATPPLEQNMALVELNRLKSMRESAEGKLEVTMFELRNLIGMKPEELLRLRGDFGNLIDQLPPVA